MGGETQASGTSMHIVYVTCAHTVYVKIISYKFIYIYIDIHLFTYQFANI